MSAASAQHDRAAILNRVAEGVWSADPGVYDLSWGRAVVLAQRHDQLALADAVMKTRVAARAAIGALIIGTAGRTEDVRLAMAGEHATGVVGGLCVEAFDAMLTEILE